MQFVHSSINNPEKLHLSKSNTFITWIPIVCKYHLHNNNISIINKQIFVLVNGKYNKVYS